MLIAVQKCNVIKPVIMIKVSTLGEISVGGGFLHFFIKLSISERGFK